MGSQIYVSAALPPGKEPDTRRGWMKPRAHCALWKRGTSPALARKRTSDRPAPSLLTMSTRQYINAVYAASFVEGFLQEVVHKCSYYCALAGYRTFTTINEPC
jgi:hypothetical protein